MNRVEKKQELIKRLGIKESDFEKEFPEFFDVKNNFIYGEVRDRAELSNTQKALISIGALLVLEGDDLKEQIGAALKQEVSPEEIQEVFHQAAPYIGFPKVEKGLKILKETFSDNEILLPLKVQGTVTEEDRLEKGIMSQKSIFGPMIDAMRAGAPDNQKFIQDYLSAYCFGDTYTRNGLDIKTRELLTFVFIICLGGCDSQARSHAMGNLIMGNSPEVLFETIAQCLPYIGFPRTLNAVTAVNETIKLQSEMK